MDIPPVPPPAAQPTPASGPPDVIADLIVRYGDQTVPEPPPAPDAFRGDMPLSAAFEPNWFTDSPPPPEEVQALWLRIMSSRSTPAGVRSALREFAANDRLLATQSPMELKMLIVRLSQVMEMEPADEKAIVRIIRHAARQGKLAEVSEELLSQEKFYAIYNRLSEETKKAVAPLIAANLPDYFPRPDINAATIQRIQEMRTCGELGQTPYDVIIVPGYTPLGATEPTRLTPQARARLRTAVEDFRAGKAPFILVSGAAVHPESSRINEANIMRDALIEDFGIPADRILVEGLARHSTTNLRNAGRMMLELGLQRGEIVSDPGFMGLVSQSDYFNMIFFNLRYLNNHGQWAPGYIENLDNNFLGIGNKRNLFIPDPGIMQRHEINDPLDP